MKIEEPDASSRLTIGERVKLIAAAQTFGYMIAAGACGWIFNRYVPPAIDRTVFGRLAIVVLVILGAGGLMAVLIWAPTMIRCPQCRRRFGDALFGGFRGRWARIRRCPHCHASFDKPPKVRKRPG
jgi:hypothetical protein